jgi:hypothetical protein
MGSSVKLSKANLSQKLPMWWVVPFVVSTLCMVILQVGPRPLAKALRIEMAVNETEIVSDRPACKARRVTVPAPPTGAVNPPILQAYRPMHETLLLSAHDTATEEIRERISQEHVYFALKFSIIGAILIVLFRLTRRGDIDEFLQMRRAALFFSAALLACGIVDTRLRFNSLIMETLGDWIRNDLQPCISEVAKTSSIDMSRFVHWEDRFRTAETSLVMATLRYFSLSLTALLHAVFLYLFIVLPTRAHKPTLWLVVATSVALHLLVLPIGASYCRLHDLIGQDSSIGFGTELGYISFVCSLLLAALGVSMVAVMARLEWGHKKYFLDLVLQQMICRLQKRISRLADKAARIRSELRVGRRSSSDRDGIRAGDYGPSMGTLQGELRSTWEEKTSLASTMKKLLERWLIWREDQRIRRSELPEVGDVVASYLRRDELDSQAELPADREEYLWNLYLHDRDRRHTVSKKDHAPQTQEAWWEFLKAEDVPVALPPGGAPSGESDVGDSVRPPRPPRPPRP